MKNELLKNIICNKEEEISVKQKELGIIKYGLMSAKTSKYLKKYTKEEIKAMSDFTDEYLECKQRDINTLKELCNRYKKEYNLEDNKMKLSEFKKEVIKEFGERGWNKLKETFAYKVYIAPEEEQLEMIKKDPFDIKFINNPSEEIQLEAIKTYWNTIDEIYNPSKKTLMKILKEVGEVTDLEDLFKHIENDFPKKETKGEIIDEI